MVRKQRATFPFSFEKIKKQFSIDTEKGLEYAAFLPCRMQ